jgi:uncharacterized protein (DUF2141 family)/peptidoglycan/LPS O-acetylase OafA/YrhL
MPTSPAHALWRYIAGLTFTAGFHYVTFFPTDINGPFWSISFEVFSYLLLPIFMAGLFFLLKKRSFKISIGYWLGVLVLIILANGFVIEYFQTDTVNKGWEYGLIGGAKYWMPYYNPVGFFAHYRLGILAAGCLIGLGKHDEIREKLAKGKWFDYIAILGLLLFAGILWTQRMTPELGFSWQKQPYYYPYLAASMAMVLAVAPYTQIVGRLLDNAFFKFTAKISFGLYIWHQFIMDLYAIAIFPDYFVFHCDSFVRWVGATAMAVATAYLIATLSWYFIEKPILDAAHGKARTPVDRKNLKLLLKSTLAIIICGAFLTNPALTENSSQEAVTLGDGSGKLRVEITNIHSANGKVVVSLCNSPKDFPEAKSPFKSLTVPISGNSAEAVFTDVPYGTYAITLFHDENNNNQLDMNGSTPAEGYGASKNPAGFPSFSGCKFTVTHEEEVQTIKMNYL